MIDQGSLDQIVGKIREVISPVRIVLFGSAARGTEKDSSDLDVLVVAPEGTHRRRTAQNIYMNFLEIDHSVDLVVATESDLEKHGDNFSLVYYPAIREGREIYVSAEANTRLT